MAYNNATFVVLFTIQFDWEIQNELFYHHQKIQTSLSDKYSYSFVLWLFFVMTQAIGANYESMLGIFLISCTTAYICVVIPAFSYSRSNINKINISYG